MVETVSLCLYEISHEKTTRKKNCMVNSSLLQVSETNTDDDSNDDVDVFSSPDDGGTWTSCFTFTPTP